MGRPLIHAKTRRYGFNLNQMVLLIAAAVLVGCGDPTDSSTGADPPGPVQACEVLKVSEVETLLGAPVSEPQRTHKENAASKHWMSMCRYDCPEKQLGVALMISPHGRAVTGKEAFAIHESQLKASLGQEYTLDPVEGVGDHAGWGKSEKQLTVFQGPFMITVGIVGPKIDEPEALAISKQISSKFIDNLP